MATLLDIANNVKNAFLHGNNARQISANKTQASVNNIRNLLTPKYGSTGYNFTQNVAHGLNRMSELPQQFGALGNMVQENNLQTPQFGSNSYNQFNRMIPFQQNPITQNVFKPFAQATYNNVFSKGIGNVAQGIGQGNPLQVGEGLGRQGLAGLSLYNLANPFNPQMANDLVRTVGISSGLGGAIGGGLAAWNGEDIGEGARAGAYRGAATAPGIAGVGRFSNPLQDKISSQIGGRFNNPLLARAAQFMTGGALSIPEGYAMNTANDQPYTQTDAVTDFITGGVAQGFRTPLTKADKNQLKTGIKGITNSKGGIKIPGYLQNRGLSNQELKVRMVAAAESGDTELAESLKADLLARGAKDVTLTDPFNPIGKDMSQFTKYRDDNLLHNKLVEPVKGSIHNPANINPEAGTSIMSGWKTPTAKAEFDTALFNKDVGAIQKLLPSVPAKYRADFDQQIQNALGATNNSRPIVGSATGATTTPGLFTNPSFFKSALGNEKGFVRLGKKATDQKFDTGKFEVTATQAKTLKNLQKTLGLDTRTVRSFDEMKAVANELGTNPQKLLSDIQNNRITDSEVIALGQQVNSSTSRISTLFKQLKQDPTNEVLQHKLSAEEQLLEEAVSKRIKGGSEAGRAVAAFRAIANKNLDPAYWIDKARRQVGIENKLKPDEIDAINDLVGKKDTLGLANFISGLGESTVREKLIGLWKAGLLTGFRTHEANLISNTAMGAMETIKDIPATVFDIARSAVTGGPRTKSFDVGEITSQPSGAFRGLKQGASYLKTGIDPRDAQKAELYRKLRFGDTIGGKFAQKYTDGIFGALGAEDKIFREAAFNRSMSEQLKVAQINGELSPEVAAQIRQNLNGITDNPVVARLQERAAADAAQATFNKENALASAIAGFKKGGNAGTRTAIDVTAPFVRTPTNVVEAMFDYSPAGIVKDALKKVWDVKSVDDRRLAESFGRSTIGSGIIALGYVLAQHGMVNGAGPQWNSAEAAHNDLAGIPNNSVFVAGKWRKLDRISPIGNLLILGAEAFKNGGDVAATAFGGVKSLAEMSFLKGLSGALSAINDPEQSMDTYVNSTVSSFLPTIGSDIARATDTFRRDTSDGLVSKMTNRVPGLRQELPKKLGPDGLPLPENGGIGAMIDPFNSTTPNADPMVQEMSRVGYNLNYMGKTLNDEKLPPDIQREYQRRAGESIRSYVPKIIASPSYKRANKDTQRDMIEKAVTAAKNAARDLLKLDMQTGKVSEGGGLVPTANASEDISSSLVTPASIGLSPSYLSAPSQPPAASKIEQTIARQQVQLTGEPQKLGNMYYYLNDQGNAATLDLDRQIYKPTLSGSDALDKLEYSKQKSSITSKRSDVLKMYELGLVSPEEASAQIEELDAAYKEVSDKTAKPKKPKKPKKITIRSTQTRAFTPFKIKSAPAPKLKIKGLSAVKVFKVKKFKASKPYKVSGFKNSFRVY